MIETIVCIMIGLAVWDAIKAFARKCMEAYCKFWEENVEPHEKSIADEIRTDDKVSTETRKDG